MSRVYLPATLDRLAAYVAAGQVAGVEGVVADSEDEADEYAALVQAAADSQALLDADADADPSAGPGGTVSTRRVVLVADLGPGGDPDAPVSLRQLVAVHADAAERPPDADPDDDLGWYAVQEVDALLATR